MPTPMPFGTIITEGVSAISDLGLYGFLLAGLVIGLGAAIFRRFGGRGR